MPFKTILSVTTPNLGDGDLQVAISLCQSTGAHLSVLVLQMAAPPPVGEYGAIVSDAWVQERQEDMQRLAERSQAVTAHLTASSVSADVAAEYAEGAWADDVIGRRGRYADLTVVGPDVLNTDTLKAKVLEGALFLSGKPLLLLPAGAPASLKPKRILIGWDAGIEASRAVREALEMLIGADEVHLVLVDPTERENGHGAEPGADLATYLARHGVKVSVERLPSEGHSVAEVLRRCARDFDADMLVLGAYGHSRLRERIFGGVTRSILEEPPLAVFLAR